MRGAERPGKVKWSRPFLHPLKPLSVSASRQIFVEVAEEPATREETALDELLTLSGNLPLAISLMANIVSFEGYSGALSRWHEENTILLSDGHDKSSNLEKSIVLSLNGPRMSSSPNARNLLSLLSLLPDGITVKDLIACQVPIPQIGQCASSLVQTSLAYVDNGGHIKCLVPIREYIRRVNPPSLALSRPLQTHLEHFVSMWGTSNERDTGHLASIIMAFLGNINELISHGLSDEGTSLLDIANSIITLDRFSGLMLRGVSPLMEKLRNVAEVTGIPWVKWKYRCRQLQMGGQVSAELLTDAEFWINEGVDYFGTVQCPIEEVIMFYHAASGHYLFRRDFQQAIGFNDVALSLGKQTTDFNLILSLLQGKIKIAHYMQDPSGLLRVAKEARALARLTWNTRLEIEWLDAEASAHYYLGNLPRARALTERLHELVIDMCMEDSDYFLGVLDIRTDIHLAKTEYLEAKKFCDIGITKASPTSAPRYYAFFLVQRAFIGILTGGKENEILDDVDAAEAVYKVHDVRILLLCSWVRAELDLEHGHLCTAPLGIFPAITASCLAALGDPQNKLDDPWSTLRWAMTYFVFTRKNKRLVGTLHALRCLADVFAALDDEETALHLFHTALDGATKTDIHRLRAECMSGIGDIMDNRENVLEAKEMWEAAHPLFVRSSQTKAATAIKAQLERLSSVGDNQEDIVESADVSHSPWATANQDGSRKVEWYTHLSAPQNSASPVAKSSMQPVSANGFQNATGESNCTIQYLFRS
ncbi:hypothetical protein B0H14DRAFT_2832882 [Mycena olivaceomarginata]|nr:hypothetical protein B0H14DRAFT_2832882 [Mycena olivaceomarginata]